MTAGVSGLVMPPLLWGRGNWPIWMIISASAICVALIAYDIYIRRNGRSGNRDTGES